MESGHIEIPEHLDSCSLTDLMAGNSSNWDNESISQYLGQYLMIKQDQLKYHYYGPEMPEILWDLEQDPGETINLIFDPSYTDVLEQFRNRRDHLGFSPEK